MTQTTKKKNLKKKCLSPYKWAVIKNGWDTPYCLFVTREQAQAFIDSKKENKLHFKITEVIQ